MVNYNDAHRPFIKQQHGLPEKPLEPEDIVPLPYMGLDTPELRKQTANYYNCMMRLDTGIGQLMDVVEQTGKKKNTIVIYLGDHGADILRGKRTSFEAGVRIPLIIRWPGVAPEKQVRDELVSLVDLFPTFCEVAGLEPLPSLPGRSLVSLLKGGKPAWRKYLFTEFHLHSGHNFYPQRTVRDNRYKLIHNLLHGEVNPGYAFTNNRFFGEGEIEQMLEQASKHVQQAYQNMRVSPEYELFDLEQDPFEFHNLAANPDHSKVLKQLQDELLAWRKRTNDPLLDSGNLQRLKAEVAKRWETGKYKNIKHWDYPNYFMKKAD